MARDRDDREEDEEDEEERPRRRPRDEDDEYEARRPPQTANPGSAKAAGILWMIFGALAITSALIQGMVLAAVGGFTTDVIIRLAVGAAFLVTGIQTLTGSVSSIKGAGIASVILASLGLIAGIVIFVAGAALGAAGGSPLLILVAAIALIGPTMLMVGGILAIVGSKKYALWRAYTKQQARADRRRPDRDDYEEDDDRPRRKRRRDEDDD